MCCLSHVIIAAYMTGVTSNYIPSVLIYTNLIQIIALTVKIMFFLSVGEI